MQRDDAVHADARRFRRPSSRTTAGARRRDGLADGIVVTPSHNPPRDGGFKYNPPHGGPADTDVTDAVQARANELLRQAGAGGELTGVKRLPYDTARRSINVREHDFLLAYLDDLPEVIDLPAIAKSGLKLGVDPMGGASVQYWSRIAERFGLDLTVVNQTVDPRFAFMPLDHDGKIRMDCSSPYAMANLLRLKDRYAVAFGNDTDADRHGIVTPAGLMNPNHYLAVAISYLFAHRPGLARAARRSARRWCRARSSTRWSGRWGVGCTRCRSGSSGSSRGCSTAAWDSAAKRAPAAASCATTAARSPRTRTA